MVPLLNIPTAGSPAVLGQHHTGSLLLEAGQEGAPLQPQPGQPCVVQNHCHHLSGALQQGTSILQSRKDQVLCLTLWDGDDWPSDPREANQPSPRNLHGRWAKEWVAPPGPLTHPKGWRWFFKKNMPITAGSWPRKPLLLTRTAPETHPGLLRPSAGLHCFYRLFEEQTSLLAPRKQVLQTLQGQHKGSTWVNRPSTGCSAQIQAKVRGVGRPDFLSKEKALPLTNV